jgi:potassium voltage-gated channel Shal-related subfamily D protein
MAKNASGAAFISSKKRAEERMRAKESGIELDDCQENFLEMQHHHLLSCLEQTTVKFSCNFCTQYFIMFHA